MLVTPVDRPLSEAVDYHFFFQYPFVIGMETALEVHLSEIPTDKSIILVRQLTDMTQVVPKFMD
jgi:hypothetical protein